MPSQSAVFGPSFFLMLATAAAAAAAASLRVAF